MTVRLVECVRGERIRIVSINAGRAATLKLMNLGLSVGQAAEVIRCSPLHGPVLLSRGDTEVALGYHLAEKILVEKD